jgi:transposase
MNQFDPKYMQLLVSKLYNINQGNQTVVSVAKDLNVSRQTVYKYLFRYRRYGEMELDIFKPEKEAVPLITGHLKRLNNVLFS